MVEVGDFLEPFSTPNVSSQVDVTCVCNATNILSQRKHGGIFEPLAVVLELERARELDATFHNYNSNLVSTHCTDQKVPASTKAKEAKEHTPNARANMYGPSWIKLQPNDIGNKGGKGDNFLLLRYGTGCQDRGLSPPLYIKTAVEACIKGDMMVWP